MSDDISQQVEIAAGVERVYRTYTDSTLHGEFTGAPAVFPERPGQPFSTHGGAIEGWVLELEPSRRVVQAWRPADWPDGQYSIVRLDFAGDEDATTITLTHTALPPEGAEHIAAGWTERYWTPLAQSINTG